MRNIQTDIVKNSISKITTVLITEEGEEEPEEEKEVLDSVIMEV